MDWNKELIKALRKRLGWSQADLARRLGIDSLRVYTWESGEQTPLSQEAQLLDLIKKQADTASEEIAQAVEAERFLAETDLSQCEIKPLNTRQLDN